MIASKDHGGAQETDQCQQMCDSTRQEEEDKEQCRPHDQPRIEALQDKFPNRMILEVRETGIDSECCSKSNRNQNEDK
jgi:hypothetical protein